MRFIDEARRRAAARSGRTVRRPRRQGRRDTTALHVVVDRDLLRSDGRRVEPVARHEAPRTHLAGTPRTSGAHGGPGLPFPRCDFLVLGPLEDGRTRYVDAGHASELAEQRLVADHREVGDERARSSVRQSRVEAIFEGRASELLESVTLRSSETRSMRVGVPETDKGQARDVLTQSVTGLGSARMHVTP
jgi:hypothetical protein